MCVHVYLYVSNDVRGDYKHIYTHVQLIHVLSSLAVLVLPDVGIRQETRCGKVENGSEQSISQLNSISGQIKKSGV